jgi:hypothetical protein
MQIQNRIKVIIAIKFLCWAPFIIMSALHNRKVIDATEWYVYFAMAALPLNAVINPLIYDDELKRSINDKFQQLVTSIANSSIIVSIRGSREQNRTEDGMEEMELVPNVPQIHQEQDVIESAEK